MKMEFDGLDVSFLQSIVSLLIPPLPSEGLDVVKVEKLMDYLEVNDFSIILMDLLSKTRALRISMNENSTQLSQLQLSDIVTKSKKEWQELEKIITLPLLSYYFTLNSSLRWIGIEELVPIRRNIKLEPYDSSLVTLPRKDA